MRWSFPARFRDFWGGLKGAGTSKPSPPDAVRPTPPLPPTGVCYRGGWGLRAAALREGRPHTPPTATEASWAAIGDGPFCCRVIRIGRPPIGAPDRIAGPGRVELAIEGW